MEALADVIPVAGKTAESGHVYVFAIFGLSVRLTVDDRRLATITHAFMDAYRPPPRPRITGDPDLRFSVSRVRHLPPPLDVPVAIHRTKHPYWNLTGTTDVTRKHHVWPSRGIALHRQGCGCWSVSVDAAIDPVFASEAIFHAIRSVALYRRPAGNLLHGSAVAIGGHVVGLIGPSMAGKTTLMAALLDAGDYAPFANDRFLVLPDADLSVLSWPSYASFCEGQLLASPMLAAAARAYERDTCDYRTRRWGTALSPTFDKAGKRTYPMRWLRDAYRRDYVRDGRLAAIVCCRVSAEIDRLRLTVSAREDALAFLAESTFDTVEPSFLPWHGLEPPEAAPPHADLLDRFAATGGALLRLEVPIHAIGRVAGALHDALPQLRARR